MSPTGQDSRRLPINGGRSAAAAAAAGVVAAGENIANRLAPDAPAQDAPQQQNNGLQPDAQATSLAAPVKQPTGPNKIEPRPGTSTRIQRPPQTAVPGPVPPRPEGGPERREDIDPISLTAEMEPISEMVVQKRKVDATLARFSAVHDEMVAEEEERRTRRKRIMPWLAKDDDLEEALSGKAPSPVEAVDEQFDDDEDYAEHEAGAGAGGDDEPPKSKSRPGLFGIKGPKNKKVSLALKVGAIAAALAVLALTGIEWGTQNTDNNQIQEVAALDENSPAIANGAKQSGDENFLFVGTNARAGVSNSDITTDTVMVAHIPADHSRVEIVSFPGNLQVSQP